MNQESKFKVWLKGAAMKAKESIGPIVALMIPGIIIGGSVTALHDSRRINKLEKRFQEHVSIGNDNVDKVNSFMHETRDQIDTLTRQNNQLFERALKETEGKAS